MLWCNIIILKKNSKISKRLPKITKSNYILSSLISRIEKLEETYKSVIKNIGLVDILVNNASAFDYDSLESSTSEIFDRHINVNLKAPFFLVNIFKKSLGSKNGLIINLLDQRVKNITPLFHLIYD